MSVRATLSDGAASPEGAATVLRAAASTGGRCLAGGGGGCERSAGRGPSVMSPGRRRPNQRLGAIEISRMKSNQTTAIQMTCSREAANSRAMKVRTEARQTHLSLLM